MSARVLRMCYSVCACARQDSVVRALGALGSEFCVYTFFNIEVWRSPLHALLMGQEFMPRCRQGNGMGRSGWRSKLYLRIEWRAFTDLAPSLC